MRRTAPVVVLGSRRNSSLVCAFEIATIGATVATRVIRRCDG